MNTSIHQSKENHRPTKAPSIINHDAPYATISELAEVYDIETNIVRQRLQAHWPLEKALTTHN